MRRFSYDYLAQVFVERYQGTECQNILKGFLRILSRSKEETEDVRRMDAGSRVFRALDIENALALRRQRAHEW